MVASGAPGLSLQFSKNAGQSNFKVDGLQLRVFFIKLLQSFCLIIRYCIIQHWRMAPIWTQGLRPVNLPSSRREEQGRPPLLLCPSAGVMYDILS